MKGNLRNNSSSLNDGRYIENSKPVFEAICKSICAKDFSVKPGKMMSSAALVYENRVFAFFSRKQRMVIKLGKDFDPLVISSAIRVFNPFQRIAPLNGWFELPFSEKELWYPMVVEALYRMKHI